MEPLNHGDVITVTEEMQVQQGHVGCLVRYEGFTVGDGSHLSFWCPSHQQWAYAFSTGKTYHYAGFPDIEN